MHDDLHLLFECDRPLAGSSRYCLNEIDRVVIGRGAERVSERRVIDGLRTLLLTVPDARLAARHASLSRTGQQGWDLDATRSGSAAVAEPPRRAVLADGSTFELGHTHFLLRSRVLPAPLGSGELGPGVRLGPVLSSLSHECEALFRAVLEATQAGVPVLVMGEAGSGKDALALALHEAVGRSGEFVRIECRALGHGVLGGRPSELLLSELAEQFKRARGGTLFLNEIEGLDPEAQLALLGIVKAGPCPGGATVISSMRTNHDLRPEVPRIRADLLAELAGLTLRLKPLRDRREDLGSLLSSILAGMAARASVTSMDPRMGQALLLHSWPYNLSELESCVRTAVALSRDGRIHWAPATLFHLREPEAAATPSEPPPESERRGVPSASPEPDAGFVQGVRRALRCNLSVPGLQGNALLESHMVLEVTGGSSAPTVAVPVLRELVLSAVQMLESASPRGERQSRVLKLTFIKPAPTQQEAADRLAMAFGTYRRYVTTALAELTALLWFNELSARARRESTQAAAEDLESEPALSRIG